MPSKCPALALLGALLLMSSGQLIQAQMNLLQKATELAATDFVSLAEQGSLNATLTGTGFFTVFVPTNEAIEDLSDDIKSNATLLESILTYHVISGNLSSGDITNDLKQASLNGKNIRFNTYTVGGNAIVLASGRLVSTVDQGATNGIIHLVDAVLMPPVGDAAAYLTKTATLSSLKAKVATALVTANIAVDPITLFAPNDAAFTSATWAASLTPNELANVLKFHLLNSTTYSEALTDGMTAAATQGNKVFVTVNDDDVYINNAKVTATDVTIDNGVVHIIDAVLMPPAGTAIDYLTSENFTTLLSAIQFAELTAIATDTNGLTVFAPTDAAFAALPAGELDSLMADKAKMAGLLRYHMVGKAVFSPTVDDDEDLLTLENGKSISVEMEDDEMKVNDKSTVIKADVPITNGVLHVVDMVFDISDSPVSAAVRHIGSGLATTLCALVLAVGMAL